MYGLVLQVIGERVTVDNAARRWKTRCNRPLLFQIWEYDGTDCRFGRHSHMAGETTAFLISLGFDR